MQQNSLINSEQNADLVITNVKRWKWTNCDSKCVAGEAVASSWVHFKGGRVHAIGLPDQSVATETWESEGVRVIDAKGALLLPGLQDAHIHVAGLGEAKYYVQLDGCSSIEDLQGRVRAHRARAENSSLSWLIGTHWDQEQMGRYPNRFDLDKIDGCEDVPMLLWRACWHIAVLNTKALKLCGLLDLETGRLAKHFKQPTGGLVDLMDGKGESGDETIMGIPSGILRERAVEVAVAAMGSKSDEEKKKFILDGLRACVGCGLTGVQTNDEACYNSYVEMASQGGDNKLPTRVFLTPTIKEIGEEESSKPPCQLIRFAGKDHDLEGVGARLPSERVKIFSDGSLGAETAAIRVKANTPVTFPTAEAEEDTTTSPQTDGYSGVLIHPTRSLIAQIRTAKELGWRCEIHAIGDASAEQVLTAMRAAYEQEGDTEQMRRWRPVLTHCQVLGEDLVEIMARNGVVANVQPSFVPTDMRWVSARLSGDHLEYAYCWRLLMHRGICVAGGSDAPIESPNPFTGMYDAIYRESRSGGGSSDGEKEREVFMPDQRLTFAEALYLYTVNAAKCAGDAASEVFGQLEEGFAADCVLVDADILSDPRLLHSLVPLMVFIGGHIEVDNRKQATAESENKAPALQGPFIPGKNGQMKRGWLQCDCCRIRV